METPNVLAIDIGGTQFRLGLFDAQGRRLLLSEGSTHSSEGREWMLDKIRERSWDLLGKTERPVKACGISFGGPVDYRRQRVSSMHVAGWRGFELARWVKDTLHLDCCVDNDANAGAFGEFRYGAGRGACSIVYVTISTGIGSGLICNGEVVRGKDSTAGELGHIPISDADVTCSCGARGCLEALCSGTAIGLRARGLATRNPEVLRRTLELCSGQGEQITAEAVFRAASEGETSAQLIVRDAARWLARGFLTVIRVLNPDKIVLGGGIAQAGSLLLDPVHEFLAELDTPALQYSTEIVLAELENYSPLYGAAAMGIDLVKPLDLSRRESGTIQQQS